MLMMNRHDEKGKSVKRVSLGVVVGHVRQKGGVAIIQRPLLFFFC